MNFTGLQYRLLSHLRDRVRGGELTERGLARLTGISQPHMHNVLKGKRLLSIAMTDHLLRQLRLDVLDLVDRTELAGPTSVEQWEEPCPPADSHQASPPDKIP